MALDGISISNIMVELNEKLIGGRIDKIHQPNKDEVIILVRSVGKNYKLLLTINPNNPRIHITELSKDNPSTPPMFCMVLRKHIAGGKIVSFSQPKFERIINISIDTNNELGDKVLKTLVIEIMGKHSNVILLNQNEKVIDSLKHIPAFKSSVRQILPGIDYVLPPTKGKLNPLNLSLDEFLNLMENNDSTKIQNFIYENYVGISPIMASEILERANVNHLNFCAELSENHKNELFNEFNNLMLNIKNKHYSNVVYYEEKTGKLADFSSNQMKLFSNYDVKKFESFSELLEFFYENRDNSYRISQKAYDMKKVVQNNIERCVKKREIQEKTLRSIKNKYLWKLYGELITANIYAIKIGVTKFQTINFYDENMPEIEINLDPQKSPVENAQKYFSKYNKAKRTETALAPQIKLNDEELLYLEDVMVAIENATQVLDLLEIRQELQEEGFLKKKHTKNVKVKKTSPHHFVSSDGFSIFVGRNNTQNDLLTIKQAELTDFWLHTKNIPGSHVIVKMENKKEIPDKTLLEAATLAVYFSKAKNSSSVSVDYTLRKNVKKPKGAKPGFVIYEANKTINITVDDEILNNLKKSKNN